MRSAARSVSTERGLASARLPIGVATTYRVPVNRRVSSFVKRAMNREGARAEDLCAELLRAAGLKLVERNRRSRPRETDLIAEGAREGRVRAREADSPHDTTAVSLSWRGRKLGSVPRRENAALAWGLDRGEPLRARISRLTPHPNPSKRLEFEVYAQ